MNKGVLAGLGPGDSPDVLTSDAGQNAVLVAGNRREVPFSTTTAQAVALTDCSDLRWVSVHIASQGGSSTVTWQVSNDGINWVQLPLTQSTMGTGSAMVPAFSATSTGMWTGPVIGRYFRLNVTGIASGTTSGVVEFFSVPLVPSVSGVVAAISGNYGGGSTVSVASGTPSDAASNSASTGVVVFPAGYNGSQWDRLRVPTVFKTATATASGDTALWTPAAGKKFRLMRYRIEVTNDAATSGGADIDVVLRDATTATAAAMSLYVPAVSGTALGAASTGWVDLGNGILSAANNNVLNINLSAALTAGKVRVVACGTEE